MNILCNPTGQKGKFRAIDWLVEHNNLYMKVRNKYYCALDVQSNPNAADLWRKILKPSEALDSQRIPPHRDIQEHAHSI